MVLNIFNSNISIREKYWYQIDANVARIIKKSYSKYDTKSEKLEKLFSEYYVVLVLSYSSCTIIS